MRISYWLVLILNLRVIHVFIIYKCHLLSRKLIQELLSYTKIKRESSLAMLINSMLSAVAILV